MKKIKFTVLLGMAAMMITLTQGMVVTAGEEVQTEKSGVCYMDENDAADSYSVPKEAAEKEPAVLQAGESYRAELKRRMLEAILAYESWVDVSDLNLSDTEETFDMLNMLVREIKYENPYLIYAYRYEFAWWVEDPDTHEKTLTEIKMTWDQGFRELIGEDTGDATLNTYRVLPEKVAAYRTAVDKALSHVKDEMSTLEKILALHDYLVLNCEYDYENFKNSQWYDEAFSAYGAVVNQIAQPMGYAYAFENLMQHIGVECFFLTSGVHCWNMVYVDGNWYHVDTAYDDPIHYVYTVAPEPIFDDWDKEGYVSHRYFLVSDSELDYLDSVATLWGGSNYNHEHKSIGNEGWAVPEASKDGAYAGYIFRDEALDTTATYYNGEWYYIPGAVSGTSSKYITKSKIDGSGATTLDSLGLATYVQVERDYLYYSRSDDLYTDGIYAVKLGGTLKPERMFTMVGSKAYYAYSVGEFAVRNNKIAIVLCQTIPYYDTEKWVRLEYYTNRRETTPMPTLKVVPGQLNYLDRFEDEEREAVSTYLSYSDGGKIPVSCHSYDIEATPVDDIVYTVSAYWRGLSGTTEVSFNPIWPITDVFSVDKNWIYPAAKYVYDKQYMTGTSASTFEPGKKMERSMFAQILYSMEGKPSVTFVEHFEDVPENGWFADAVTWAFENNIVSGYDADTFGTYDPVTRQQLALMLKGYAEALGIDTGERADISGFTDVSKISSYALDAVQWAVAEGVMAGKGEKLDPLGNATRAEGAAMIRSFCEKVKNVKN